MPKTLRTMISPRYLSLLGAITLTLGCGDPIGPASYTGTYVLRSLEGGAIPAVIVNTSDLYIALVADTLKLTDASSGTWTTHFQWHPDSAPMAPNVLTVPVTIERVGSDLYLTEQWPCPDGAVCSPLVPRKLEIVGAELRVTTRAGAHRFERLVGSGSSGSGSGGYGGY